MTQHTSHCRIVRCQGASSEVSIWCSMPKSRAQYHDAAIVSGQSPCPRCVVTGLCNSPWLHLRIAHVEMADIRLLATVKGVENLYSDRGKMLGVKGLHTNNSGLHLHKAPSFPRAKLAPHNRICMSLYCQSVKYT